MHEIEIYLLRHGKWRKHLQCTAIWSRANNTHKKEKEEEELHEKNIGKKIQFLEHNSMNSREVTALR